MNKSIDFAKHGTPLEILSATAADNIDNYIFVEAFRKNSVSQAIYGLNFCLGKIEMLTLNEMPKIYESKINSQRPEPMTWVRIKSGLYDGDIGIIDKIIGDDKIRVKLVPRINNPLNDL
jgi:hypothetical protein